MAGCYLIPLILLLVSMVTVVQSGGVCSYEVQDGCSCSTDAKSLVSVTCEFNAMLNVTGPLITSNLTESVGINLLDISNNSLTDLPSDFFHSILSVSQLDLSHNRFTSNPLSREPKKTIQKLNLSNNRLSELTMEDFAEMLSLKNLDISFNQIGRVSITDGNYPLRFDSFNISHNLLQSVPTELWKLTVVLDLSYNRLDIQLRLPECRLRHLYLTENNISRVLYDAFYEVPTLETLYLDYNRLAEINRKSFSGAQSLTDINLEHNVLKKIETDTFRDLYNLAKINLAGNEIEKIDGGVFAGLDFSLSRLSLKGNRIADIHPKAFGRLENLRYLDLSDNPALTDVSAIGFPPHVAHLDLENCGLTSIQDCVLAGYRDLQFLGLADNNLTCSCHLSWLHNWQKSVTTASTPSGRPEWTCLDSNRGLVQVSYDPSSCNITTHLRHCQPGESVAVDPDSIGLDVTVEAGDGVVTATWSLQTDAVIRGFVVTYDTKETTMLESPLLESSVSRYDIREEVKIGGSYVVCVRVLLNETYTVKKVCQEENSYVLQMIIGILAGVVFLIPCIVALAYILYKDYRVMKSTYDYLYDAENPNDSQHEVKGDKHGVKGDKHEVKGDKVDIGKHVNVVQASRVRFEGSEVAPLDQMLAAQKQAPESRKTEKGKGDNSMSNPAFVPDSGTTQVADATCVSDSHKSAPLKSTENSNTKL